MQCFSNQIGFFFAIYMYQLILVKPQLLGCFDLGHAACCYFSHANNQVCPSIHSMMEILKFYRIKLMTNPMRGHLFISQINPGKCYCACSETDLRESSGG